MISLKRRTLIRLVSFTAAALVVLGGFTASANQRADHNRYLLEVRYQHAFTEFVNSIGEIDSSLQKSYYATTPPMTAAACADVYGKTTAALAALGNLPFSDYQLENIASFVSKTGDYSFMLAKKASMSSNYTDDELVNLQSLSQIAGKLHASLREVENDLSGGAITISELQNDNRKLEEAAGNSPGSLGESFKSIESEFPEIPSLVYDGPFSEHINARSPKWIENLDEVDEQTALETAKRFSGVDSLTSQGMREGNLPCYYFTDGDSAVSVTVKGGKPLQFRKSRPVNDSKLSTEDALAKASEFLDANGYGEMLASYHTLADNVLTINFAFVQDEVICYPDLVKICVALDDGMIVGFESTGYVMNHVETREIPVAEIDETGASRLISSDLTILSNDMAVIPTSGENEVFVYEFKCENPDGKHYIVCVNALTGNEEKILILIEDENGTLAI
ncbi:MAG: germination protein YpeB [Oscillospiraceae bacterium]|jgi:germination protein YpeB|nr:germination protein YpeB [Oscillospiraceae bacterium]